MVKAPAGFLKLADIVLILINPSLCYVKEIAKPFMTFLSGFKKIVIFQFKYQL
jgi:hypothetical protein